MDLKTALSIFKDLEGRRYDPEPGINTGTEPIFDVRLDAGTDRDDGRSFRVRVTIGSYVSSVSAETWQVVLDVAAPYGLSVAAQNNGLELS